MPNKSNVLKFSRNEFSRKRYPPNDGAQTRDPVIAVRLRVVTQHANNFPRAARLSER
jgi:hypothetical protein